MAISLALALARAVDNGMHNGLDSGRVGVEVRWQKLGLFASTDKANGGIGQQMLASCLGKSSTLRQWWL